MKKRVFLGVALVVTLLVGSAFAFARAASADAAHNPFGQVISAINHTGDAVETLSQTSAIPLSQVALVDITPPNPIVPPNPITPPSPIRALHNAIARNAEDILALRALLPSVQVTVPDCGQCATTLASLLQSEDISVGSVATATFSSSGLTIYFLAGDPCVQDPLNACRDSGEGD